MLTFALLIVLGTVVLAFPVCHGRGPVGLLDAFFTATSAVCVTGLITKDTAVDFSRTGQVVILVLIQLGGLGVMTFGALAFELVGRRVSLRSQAALADTFFQGAVRGGLRRAIRRIVGVTVVCELVGAVLMLIGLRANAVPPGGVFEALFTSVSAFCNAGFSVYSDSVERMRGSALMMSTLMALIILGGLGHTVIFEVLGRMRDRLTGRRSHPVVWTLHARLVLLVSAALIVLGAAALLLTGLTPDVHGTGQRVAAAFFQSVTTRTAGFNSVDIGALPLASLMVMIPLMFIGGSPGSCAGGVKTTSVAVWLARVVARLRGDDDVALFGRRIPHDVVRRTALLLAVAVLWNGVGVFVLALSEHAGDGKEFQDIIFEQVSAFGTVGLSTGITASLSTIGKLWIIASMFFGRLGPLTIALVVVTPRRRTHRFHYPQERVMIG